MANEELKDIVRRMFDAFNRGDTTALESIVSPSFVEHEDLGPGVPLNRAGLIQWLKSLRQSFPDAQFKVEEIAVDGDRVWCRGVVTGTHRGEFMGIPASGKSTRAEFLDEIRFDNYKIAEHWGQFDSMALMQQIGAMQMSGTRQK